VCAIDPPNNTNQAMSVTRRCCSPSKVISRQYSCLVQAQDHRLGDTAALYQALGGGWWNRPGNSETLKFGNQAGKRRSSFDEIIGYAGSRYWTGNLPRRSRSMKKWVYYGSCRYWRRHLLQSRNWGCRNTLQCRRKVHGKTASRIAPDAGVTAKQEIDALTAVPDAVTTGVSAK